MFCPKCGKEIDNNSNYCKYCGAVLLEECSADATDKTESSSAEAVTSSKKRKKFLIPVFLLILVICVAIPISYAVISMNNESKVASKTSSEPATSSSYSSSYSGLNGSSYSSSGMSHSTYCLLYMKVSNVNVTHNGNYAYVTGTILNKGTYKIRYVKVKAVCKDKYGSIVDTDWTYAVDSSWLEPGESKKFEIMIKDTYKEISTAKVTIESD